MSKWKQTVGEFHAKQWQRCKDMGAMSAECPRGSKARSLIRKASMVWLNLRMPLSQQALWS